MRLLVDKTWDGEPIAPAEVATLDVELAEDGLHIRVSAPYHGDPEPAGPPGPTDGLWEHEVVELFLVGPGERYTEIELGPLGHHLVLRLEGIRVATERCLPLEYGAHIQGSRWTGQARLGTALLPPHPVTVNAYAIHGVGEERRYLAMTPVPGPQPDFHRIGMFVRHLEPDRS